jgi:hypothetical protein
MKIGDMNCIWFFMVMWILLCFNSCIDRIDGDNNPPSCVCREEGGDK